VSLHIRLLYVLNAYFISYRAYLHLIN